MKKYTTIEVSNILRKCPKSYLWIKSRDVWDEIDYNNIERIEKGETVISRIEPKSYNHINETKHRKKVRATKDGISEVFESYRDFAKDSRIKVSECWVSNSIKRGCKVKGHVLEIEDENGNFYRPFIPEVKIKKLKVKTENKKLIPIVAVKAGESKPFPSMSAFAKYVSVNGSTVTKAMSKGIKVGGYKLEKG